LPYKNIFRISKRGIMFSSPKAKKSIESKEETVIIPVGLLLDLNHQRSGGAFLKLASQPGKLLPDAPKLDVATLTKLMPQILQADAKFKSGNIGEAEFRKEVCAILKLQLSDLEFDTAWNAMLGATDKLHFALCKLHVNLANLKIILVSETNPIHTRQIFQDWEAPADGNRDTNPLSLMGQILYVSYNSANYKKSQSGLDLYKDVLAGEKINPNQAHIVLKVESDTPYVDVKKRDESKAQLLKNWAEEVGLKVIPIKSQEDVVEVVSNALKAPAPAVSAPAP